MNFLAPEQALSIKPRPHQVEAVQALATAPHRFAYAEMSVASGKSLVMAFLAARSAARTRTLIIAHNEDLVTQNAKACEWIGQKPVICSSGLGTSAVFGQLTVGTVGTILNRIDYFQDVGVVIIDEVHRAKMDLNKDGSASQYRQIKEALPHAWFRGLTGTGWREDGTGSLEHTFGPKVFTYSFRDALEDGFVKPLRAVAAKARDIETKGLKTNSQGEWSGQELTNRGVALAPDHAAAAIGAMQDEGRTRAIFFACDIEHADALEKECKKLGADARAVHSMNGGRGNNVDDFRQGKFPILISVAMFNCLDLKTEILTTDGWKRHDELTANDEVANWTSSGFVFFKKPKRVIHAETGADSPMYAAQGNRHDMRVTSGHRVVHSSCQGREAESVRVEAAAALEGRKVQIPVFGNAEPFEIDLPQLSFREREARRRSLECSYRTRRGMSPEEAKARAAAYYAHLEEQQTVSPASLTLPECRFIGFWLGDGSVSRAKGGGLRWSASQSTANQKIIDWFDGVLLEAGIHATKVEVQPKNGAPAFLWSFSTGRGNGDQLRTGGVSRYAAYLNKEGSHMYRGLNRRQLLALLEGFWMADGNHGLDAEDPRGMRITGTQKKLYDVLQSVLAVRGVDSSITQCAPPKRANWAQQYTLSWNDAHLGWRTLTLKADKTHCVEGRSEPVWCVASHSTFIITRRNGKVAVTGNTGFDVPDIDFMAFMRPMKSGLLYAQSLGRGARLSDYANDCVVVDFGGNILRHGALDMIKPPQRREPGILKVPDTVPEEPPGWVCPFHPREKAYTQKRCPTCGELMVELDKIERTVGGDLRMSAKADEVLTARGKPKWVKPVGDPTFLMQRRFWIVPTDGLGKVRWFSPSYPLDAQHLYCEYDPRHGWTAHGAVDTNGVLHRA